jgi:hypothetical protein
MCLKRCPACAGWINPEDVCVECGQTFPSYPIKEEDIGEVKTERLTQANTKGLNLSDVHLSKPQAPKLPRLISVGPDLGTGGVYE